MIETLPRGTWWPAARGQIYTPLKPVRETAGAGYFHGGGLIAAAWNARLPRAGLWRVRSACRVVRRHRLAPNTHFPPPSTTPGGGHAIGAPPRGSVNPRHAPRHFASTRLRHARFGNIPQSLALGSPQFALQLRFVRFSITAAPPSPGAICELYLVDQPRSITTAALLAARFDRPNPADLAAARLDVAACRAPRFTRRNRSAADEGPGYFARWPQRPP